MSVLVHDHVHYLLATRKMDEGCQVDLGKWRMQVLAGGYYHQNARKREVYSAKETKVSF